MGQFTLDHGALSSRPEKSLFGGEPGRFLVRALRDIINMLEVKSKCSLSLHCALRSLHVNAVIGHKNARGWAGRRSFDVDCASTSITHARPLRWSHWLWMTQRDENSRENKEDPKESEIIELTQLMCLYMHFGQKEPDSHIHVHV
jgi:hypothetical protein